MSLHSHEVFSYLFRLLCLYTLSINRVTLQAPIRDMLYVSETDLFVFYSFCFVVALSGGLKRNQGRGLVDRKLIEAPSKFIAGCLEAALLFWFFGGFRCGVPLCFVILIRYNNGK